MLFAVMLAACGDDGQGTVDAAVDAIDAPIDGPPTPAIDWSIWGNPCTRSLYGIEQCKASDGQSVGLCILTGEPGMGAFYPGTCEHWCFSNPPYANECPPDGVAVHDGQHSQGCHCAQR